MKGDGMTEMRKIKRRDEGWNGTRWWKYGEREWDTKNTLLMRLGNHSSERIGSFKGLDYFMMFYVSLGQFPPSQVKRNTDNLPGGDGWGWWSHQWVDQWRRPREDCPPHHHPHLHRQPTPPPLWLLSTTSCNIPQINEWLTPSVLRCIFTFILLIIWFSTPSETHVGIEIVQTLATDHVTSIYPW